MSYKWQIVEFLKELWQIVQPHGLRTRTNSKASGIFTKYVENDQLAVF